MYKEFDKIELKTGETATIVEVLGDGKAFVADIDKDGDWETEFIKLEDISRKIG